MKKCPVGMLVATLCPSPKPDGPQDHAGTPVRRFLSGVAKSS